MFSASALRDERRWSRELSLKPRKEAVRNGEAGVVLVDEHGHESARVEAHEYKEKGGVNESMRISHELRRVNGIL